MRAFVKSISLAATALSLSSCSTALTTDQQAILNQIQQGAVTACGFLPTVETVLSLLGSGIPGGASSAINAICTAVAPASGPAKLGAAPRVGQPAQAATADGKRVNGIFVR